MKILKNILISISLLYSFMSYSSIYEVCDWTNLSLTSRIIEHTATATPLCAEFDDHGMCVDTSEDEGFFSSILTYLQEEWFSFIDFSPTDTDTPKIDNVCFLASSIKGKNTFKIQGSQHSCSDRRTSQIQRFYYCDDLTASSSCQTVMPVTDNQGNARFIYPRAPCLSEEYIHTLSTSFHNMSDCFNLSEKKQKDLFAIIHHESAFIPNSRSPTGAKCAGQLTTQALIHLNMDILLENNPAHSNYVEAIKKCPYLEGIIIPDDLLTHTNYQNKPYDELQKSLENFNFTCALISDISRCFFYSFLFHKTSIALIKQHIPHLSKHLKPEDLESFESFLSYLAYNGGHSVIRTQLGRFIDKLNCIDEVECFPEDFDINDLKSRFIDHLKQVRNGTKAYSEETLNYPYAIQRDLNYFQSNFFAQHLLNLNIDPTLTDEEITDFSLEVNEICQFNNKDL